MGKSKSCGCYIRELKSIQCKLRNTTHGESGSPEHRTWLSIKFRCTNPKTRNFHRYGGRGIKVCDRWAESYENFLADMGRKPTPKHTLDRHPNPDGHYEPGNCRWATMEEQQNNRTNNRIIEAFGQRLTSMQWAAKTGISRQTVERRLDRGWPAEAALTVKPVLGNRLKKLSSS